MMIVWRSETYKVSVESPKLVDAKLMCGSDC